jgi:hypothetical protein
MEYAGGEAGDVLGTGGILSIILEEITTADGHLSSEHRRI